ncbi:hypothetical protein AURDEDRAFT_167702 [Auricularia subglabra TFB-10046 SS5]|nr:hypothetical protein AURDEDRAFT_167702 [Auricularia subglabra TFB-10046 SS5]
MDIVESPRLSDQRAPIGALVLVTPDPVSSVAALKDPEATAAAERLHPPTVLAYIQMATDIDWSRHATQQPLSFIFNFVMRSLPQPPFAFIPLSPDGTSYHPSGREPLIPSNPLPWPNCFLYTRDTFVIRVSRMFLTDPAKICMLSKEQRRLVTEMYVQDIQTPDPSKLPFKNTTPPSSVSSDEHESPRARIRQLQNPDTSAGERQDSGTTSGSMDDDEGSDDEGSSDEDSEPRELVPSAELRLDLSTVCELGTLAEYVAYSDKLDAIERDWADRTLLRELADQPQTRRWASNVAAATTADPEAPVNLVDTAPSQASLVPEADPVHDGARSKLATELSTQDLRGKPDSTTPGRKRSLLSSVTHSGAP